MASGVEQVLDAMDAEFPDPMALAPVAVPPAETPPAPEVPPAPAPPTPQTEPPPAPPPTPPSEPAPPDAPPDVPPDVVARSSPNAAWKAKREAEKRERETLAELQAARERERQLAAREAALLRELETSKQQPTPPLDTDMDPLLAAEDRIAKLEAHSRQLEAAVQRAAVDTQIQQEANAFAREHPDYPARLQHYVETEAREADIRGEIDRVAGQLRQAAGQVVSEAARQQGITEADASRELARAVFFEQRRQDLVTGAKARGTTVPALIYELAEARGYQAPPPVTPAANGGQSPTLLNPQASAAEQVRREQAAGASNSLASMPRAGSSPPSTLTKSTFLAMDPQEQERIVYVLDAMVAEGKTGVPGDWLERMNDGESIPLPM